MDLSHIELARMLPDLDRRPSEVPEVEFSDDARLARPSLVILREKLNKAISDQVFSGVTGLRIE